MAETRQEKPLQRLERWWTPATLAIVPQHFCTKSADNIDYSCAITLSATMRSSYSD
jgi:hypothetical protein